jgi:hypothetical protein
MLPPALPIRVARVASQVCADGFSISTAEAMILRYVPEKSLGRDGGSAMSKVRRFSLAVAAGAATVTLMSPAAQAAPKGGDLFLDLACGGEVGTIQITTPPTPDNEHAKNYWTPGFIVGTHDVFIPYDLDITFTFGTESFRFAQTKPAHLQGTTTTCEVSLTPGTAPEGLTVTGTVSGVIR